MNKPAHCDPVGNTPHDFLLQVMRLGAQHMHAITLNSSIVALLYKQEDPKENHVTSSWEISTASLRPYDKYVETFNRNI